MYQAQATVLIGQFITTPNPDYVDIRTGMDLATTYVELLETRPILEGAIETLGLNYSAASIRAMVSSRVIESTSLIVINVVNTDPVLAADVANALANELVQQSPTNLTLEQQNQIDLLNNQIAILDVQVQELRGRLAQISEQLETASLESEIAQLNEERDVALEQLNLATANIGQFANTIAQIQQRTNSVTIVESAQPSTSPLGGSSLISVVLGTLVGVVAAVGLILIIEYFDDKIRTPEDAVRIMAIPILGTVIRFGQKSRSYKDMLLTKFSPTSAVNECYRSVRTNILYTVENEGSNAFVITSTMPQEGKTVTTSNLAVSMAMSGLKVLLIDADLRRPRIHDAFGLQNTVGLTTLLSAEVPQQTITPDEEHRFDSLPDVFQKCAQIVWANSLYVLTSGFVPSNPTEVLASTVMKKWSDLIQQTQFFDVILIDSPPALASVDSLVLASNIQAQVIIVLDRGKIRFSVAKRVKEQFSRLNVPIAGLIMNRMNPRDENYTYYNYYYDAPSDGRQSNPIRRFWAGRNESS